MGLFLELVALAIGIPGAIASVLAIIEYRKRKVK